MLTTPLGSGPPMLQIGCAAGVSGTAFDLNAAFVYETSGNAALYKFFAPVAQTSGALTVYLRMSAKTGTPTAIVAKLYRGAQAGQDPQRPEAGAAAIATATTVDASGTAAPAWLTFSFSGVTLVQGATYWIVVENQTATPTSHYVSLVLRPQNFLSAIPRLQGYSTTNGVTTDPTLGSSSTEPAAVIKFADGTLMGNPYSTSNAHANNSNYRGMRVNLKGPFQLAAVWAASALSSSAWTLYLYQGATLLETLVPDVAQQNSGGGYLWLPALRTLAAGLDYDFVWKPNSGNDATGLRVDAGTTPPADVTACMFQSLSYVDGATPGSFSATAGAFTGVVLVPNNLVAGGGMRLAGKGGLAS